MRVPAIFRYAFGLAAMVVALVALGAAVNQLCRHRTEGAAIREYDGWDLLESDSVRREVSLLRQREQEQATLVRIVP